ncbi:MAG TPA: DoxX family protein [Pseudoduganella sp.]|jgi:putative oxidoreductase
MLKRLIGTATPDAGLLFARLAGAALLLWVHGLPKLLHWQGELAHIDDPLHLGRGITLACALFAEVLCPFLIAAGLFTRLACLPVLFLVAVSVALVHPEWATVKGQFDGQFSWLLLIVFGTIALAGAGRWSVDRRLATVRA